MKKDKKLKKILIFLNCPLCESNDSEIKYKRNYNLTELKSDLFSARRERKKKAYEHNTFLKCKKCGMIYANPIINPALLEKLYKKSKFNYGGEEKNLKKSYGDCLKKVNKYIGNKQKILDVGTGNGFLLVEALEQGYNEVYGVEPSKHAVELADKSIKNKIIIDVLREKQFKNNFFDVICIFQTIDHITNPNNVLKICNKSLKKGGALLCVSHNVDSFSAKLMGEKSPIFDIEHVQLFSKKTIAKILEKNYFKVVKVFDIINTYTLNYWISLAPLPKSVRSSFKKISSTLGLKDKKISIKPGNFGVIAIKK
jgi:2-polyprenyl-3-methyl-5-hydroxy-6-metoxy-1,4-benzoquinol methylase